MIYLFKDKVEICVPFRDLVKGFANYLPKNYRDSGDPIEDHLWNFIREQLGAKPRSIGEFVVFNNAMIVALEGGDPVPFLSMDPNVALELDHLELDQINEATGGGAHWRHAVGFWMAWYRKHPVQPAS